LWPNSYIDQDAIWHGGRPRPRPHCVTQVTPKEHRPPQFSTHVLWQNGWMDQLPLGREVDLGPGHIVLDGDPAPPKEGHSPNFRPILLWPNGWMDQDATWYKGRPRPSHTVIDGDRAPPPKTGTASNFRPMSIVAKCHDSRRSPISATAEHLYSKWKKRTAVSFEHLPQPFNECSFVLYAFIAQTNSHRPGHNEIFFQDQKFSLFQYIFQDT